MTRQQHGGWISFLGRGGVVSLLAGSASTPSAQLPIPCSGAACASHGVSGWVQSGNASLAQSGSQMTIGQSSASVLLNWQQFNISADGTVTFRQPSAGSVAVNRVFDPSAKPSEILGSLQANGNVYILNQNGILFGSGSQVNVGGLVASSLDMTPSALKNGIGFAIQGGVPAFQQFATSSGAPAPSGAVTVQAGASITANGGQVMLFAPNTVQNSGTISTPDGQTILGAGQRVFLGVSTDPNLRGLIIQVGPGGTVDNGTPGTVAPSPADVAQIVADRGNVTLAAMAVNQYGRLSATTTTRVNGSIRLQAQWSSKPGVPSSAGATPPAADMSGTLSLGPSSQTVVGLEVDPNDRTVDINAQPKSNIELDGGTVELLDHATVSAQSGQVAINAIGNPSVSSLPNKPDTARIWLAPTSSIDVSGATDSLPISDNSLAVQLRASELANYPIQRNGPLHGQTVYVDLRVWGYRADGSMWVGSPIADLTGDISTIQRDVLARNLTGGTVSLTSSGGVFVAPGANLNVSGGQIDWQSGYVRSSALLGTDGKIYPISQADPNRSYVGVQDSITVADSRWGTSTTYTMPGTTGRGTYSAGYIEGSSAGGVNIQAPDIVLDGSILGSTVRGPLQRYPATAIPTGAPIDAAIPLGAQLTIGNPGGLTSGGSPSDVIFKNGDVLATLTNANGQPFDPTTDPLPYPFTTSVRPDLLGAGGITRLTVAGTGQITLASGTELDPGAGGSVSLIAGRVVLDGAINAPAGSISLQSLPTPTFDGSKPTQEPGVSLGSASELLTAGQWVNDESTVTSLPAAPLFTSGGSISVSSTQGSLQIPQGALLDVSGGAQLTTVGKVQAGAGGSIRVVSKPLAGGSGSALPAVFDPTLRGFAMKQGGSLSLTLPSVCVSGSTCTQKGALQLSPSILTDDGFGSVSISASASGLTVENDVNVHVEQENLALLPSAPKAPTGTPFSNLTRITLLPDYARSPENLALGATAVPFSGTALPLYSDLVIDSGATLTLDPLSGVNLTSDSQILLNGAIRAPGGSVGVAITNFTGGGLSYRADQGIWFGPQSIVNVSGTTLLTPNNLGLRFGRVLPGGSINVSAGHGYLTTLPGSILEAAGSSATLDILTGKSPSSPYQSQNVASAGGSISLLAAEGLFLSGNLNAHPGVGTGAAGGNLSVSMDATATRLDPIDFLTGLPPFTARQLEITSTASPIVLAEGSAVPDGLNGVGMISAGAITAGGFDQINLSTRTLIDQNSQAHYGTVVFDSGVTLSPAAALRVDASVIGTRGTGNIQLSSAYVALGSNDPEQFTDPAPAAGSGKLTVQAQLVDLFGTFDLAGAGSTVIASTGDIRTIGSTLAAANAPPNTPPIVPEGSLTTPGSLTLTSQQLYPTTLTSYTVNLIGKDPASSTLTIEGVPGAADEVLSAGGSLTLKAGSIVSTGTVRAPIGDISLQAQQVILMPGSVLSASANGLSIPFGTTQAGLDWVYEIYAGNDFVYGSAAGQLTPPQKSVSITADRLDFRSGATIDLSGGGDLQADEFVPGPGGTIDLLNASVNPKLFAVLPGANLPFAPIDPFADKGFTLTPGASVYLSGGDGVPAGTYALLPARYALLPGAFLVKPVSGFTDLSPGEQVRQLDGTVVISGRDAYAGTNLGDTRTSGFDVAPGNYVLNEAQYTTTSANSFFVKQAAALNAAASNGAGSSSTAPTVVAPRVPQDAGTLAITGTSAINLSGTLAASPDSGGRGSALDLSAANLVVTSQPGSLSAGSVAVDPNQLDALGAESILLGGSRSFANGRTDISVASNTVTLASDANLKAPEVLIAANQQITLQPGSRLQATGAAAAASGALEAPNGSPVLRVSTGPQAQLDTTGQLPGGTISVAAGASVAATGSLSLDANQVTFGGNLTASGAAVRFGASELGLGAVPQGYAGFGVSSALLAGLSGADLELRSPQPIQVYGAVNVSLSGLTLNAPGLESMTSSATLQASAQKVTFEGANCPSPCTPATGSGSVALSASTISLGTGAFVLSGVSTATLSATNDISLVGDGSLSSLNGDLALDAGVFQSTGAFNYAIAAQGNLTTTSTHAIAATNTSAPGGAFSLQGTQVTLGGNFALPAGEITASAGTGSVQVTAGTLLNLAGQSKVFAGETVASAGGALNLASGGGSISVDPSAVINVSSGGASAPGGAVSLLAPNGQVDLAGTVHGAGAGGAPGASLTVDAQSLDFAQLLSAGQSGGFTGAWDVRLRGAGDLAVASGQQLRATGVRLTADQGSINVAGLIDTSSANGGSITLAAGQNVEVSGTLTATALERADRGGSVTLETTNGGVFLDTGSTLNVGGGAGAGAGTGTVYIRASVSQVDTLLNADPTTHEIRLDGTINGARQLTLEAYNTYKGVTSVGDPSDPTNQSNNTYFSDASTFMSNAPAITQALGRTNDPTFMLVPGVEIQSPGDLHIKGTWDLSSWRFGASSSIPGVLTLRAGGNLYVDNTLSDGFLFDPSIPPSFPTILIDPPGLSWSYRLVAGSDVNSANPLGLIAGADLNGFNSALPVAGATPQTGASLIVARGVQSMPGVAGQPVAVRTGTGSIQIAAAQDVVLTNQASVIYTGGEEGTGIPIPNLGVPGLPQGLAYPVNGGSISVFAGRDVRGAPSAQLFTDWLWRTGTGPSPLANDPTAWTISFDNFEQGIGALGGGDLSVSAGRNIVDLGAVVPSVGAPQAATATPIEENRGILTVAAGGDILGGKFLAMAGSGEIHAGGGLLAGTPQGALSTALNPILALGDAQLNVSSRRAATIQTVLDPTLLPISILQGFPNLSVYFSTYSDNSRVSIVSAGGGVTLANDMTAIQNTSQYVTTAGVPEAYAPWLRAVALNGDVQVQGSMELWPAAHGNLDLLATDNVQLAQPGGGGVSVILSDADPASLPNVATPNGNGPLQTILSQPLVSGRPGVHAGHPLHGGLYASDSQPDTVPARIVALNGDISLQPNNTNATLSLDFSKPVDIVAGRDIVDLGLDVQHFAPDNVSVISAGRDIVEPSGRTPSGQFAANLRNIFVDGPGYLSVSAGRNINLGTSGGIVSEGNIHNAALPATGATLSVTAGADSTATYASFISTYLASGSTYDSQLIQYMQTITGEQTPLDKGTALNLFEALDPRSQAPLLEDVLFDELRAGGRSAAQSGPTHDNFTRAFTALTTLFPGSNPDLASGQKDSYSGDIDLYFSRIYTLSGGDINLLAPGGQINVGLATPPAAFGISKTPDLLGIVARTTGSVSAVAYGDTQVNQSRIFAADGGNILIWSTEGNIDAGRGAKTAISAPPPTIIIDPNTGQPKLIFPPALTGSGIQTLATSPGILPGDVDLFAPHGVVNANDAGIVAGNLTIAATAVLGTNNISVSGTSVGVPVAVTGLGVGFSSASSSTAAATSSADTSATESQREAQKSPLANAALGWLDVFVVGLGEEQCATSDLECLKRQKKD